MCVRVREQCVTHPMRMTCTCNRALHVRSSCHAAETETCVCVFVCVRAICDAVVLYTLFLLVTSQSLFERIHRNFKVHLRGQLIKLGVTPDGGPQHG